MGEYAKSKMIKQARLLKAYSQEKLAENICETETLNRYENGKLEPTDEKYSQLMKKMGAFSDRCYVTESNVSKIEMLKNQLLIALDKSEYDVAEKELKKLENLILTGKYAVEEYQFIRRIKLVILWNKKKISDKQYLEGLINLLQTTFKDFALEKFPVCRVFTEIEMLIINDIAVYFGEKKRYKDACKIYENMERYYESGIVINDHKPRYKILLNYSNFMGLSGEYDKCIEICKKGIKWLKQQGKEKELCNFLFNIGWAMNMRNENLSENEKLKVKAYIWLALKLGEYYSESPQSVELIKQYYKKIKE